MRRISMAWLGLVVGILTVTLPALAAVRSVESASFYFKDLSTGSTSQIVVNVGDQLAVTAIDGGGGTPHTVEIAQLGISSGKMAQGSTYTTPPLNTPGTFLMFCKFHKDRGHSISLVVEGPVTTTTTSTTTTTAAPTTKTTTTTTTATPTTETTTTTTAPGTQTKSSTTTRVGGVALGATGTTGDFDPDQRAATIGGTQGPDTTIAAGPLPTAAAGLTDSDAGVWIRSVWLWLFAGLPLAAMTWLVIRHSTDA